MKKILSGILAAMMLMFCFTGCSKSAEDTVMTVNGSEVSFDEYMYWLGAAAAELQSYYSNYGGAIKWDDDCMFDKGMTNAEWCIKRAGETVAEIHTIDNKAKEMKITVTDEQKDQIKEQIQQVKDTYCTGDDPDTEIVEVMKSYNFTLDSYTQIMNMNMLYMNIYSELYGENGEKLDDSKVLQYAEDNDYVTSAHILFLNTKTVTDADGKESKEDLSDAELAEKKAQAEDIVKELQAITDDSKRYDRFMELMNELSEDPGKTSFPKGYCFTKDSMVEEYDTASRELEPYAVKLVESDYGFHIIMGLPTSPDDLVMAGNSTATLRALAAPEFYQDEVDGWTKGVEAKLTSAFKNFDFTQFFTDEGFTFVSYADYQADKK